MTPEEFQDAQARLAEVDTEIAALDRTERDCIEKAREFNTARRIAASKRTELNKASADLRAACAAHVQEVHRQQAEKAKAEAEARAKEPKPPSPLELLTAQVQKLTEKLAAKG